MRSKIPIKNLYYLFCYAWNLFPQGKAVEAGFVESPNSIDLFAHVLIRGAQRLLKRGIDRGYIEFDDDPVTVRGRIDLNTTIRRNLLVKGQVHCRFDELDRDVLHNQILRTTIRDLSRSDVDPLLKKELSRLDKALDNIRPIRLTSQCFRRVQLARDRGHYSLLLSVCELLHQMRLPTEGGAGVRFSDILDDEVRMSRLFECFVRNFYRREQDEYTGVGGEVIKWDLEAVDATHRKYLPEMRTDVTLRSSARTIVIDTKYYRQTLSNYRGERVYSSHLYQLFSYLSNMEAGSQNDRAADGLLLYPVVGQRLDLTFEGRGHRIGVRTIDLAQDWQGIHDDLLSFVA